MFHLRVFFAGICLSQLVGAGSFEGDASDWGKRFTHFAAPNFSLMLARLVIGSPSWWCSTLWSFQLGQLKFSGRSVAENFLTKTGAYKSDAPKESWWLMIGNLELQLWNVACTACEFCLLVYVYWFLCLVFPLISMFQSILERHSSLWIMSHRVGHKYQRYKPIISKSSEPFTPLISPQSGAPEWCLLLCSPHELVWYILPKTQSNIHI